MGAMAPLTGQLKAGYEADILGVLANPAQDVKVLQNRNNIQWVWKGGKLYKGPASWPLGGGGRPQHFRLKEGKTLETWPWLGSHGRFDFQVTDRYLVFFNKSTK